MSSAPLTFPRKGDWIHVFGGRQCWPLDPRAGDFDIESIAHSLALTNRYNGHSKFPVSVAQHSLLVVQLCHSTWSREALMHDAPETVLGDMTRPLKHQPIMEPFCRLEDRVWRAMAEQFGMMRKIPYPVKEADDAALVTEASQILTEPTYGQQWWLHPRYPRPAPIVIEEMPWRTAERLFLECFARLFPEHNS